MKNNLEKWNTYKALFLQAADEFMDTINPIIPEVFYKIYPRGEVYECKVICREYSIPGLHFSGKRPTNKEVDQLYELLGTHSFEEKRCFLSYSYVWGEYNGKPAQATTSISLADAFGGRVAFLSKEEADNEAIKIKRAFEEREEFYRVHKKDASFDYQKAGYKFLGWQNNWKHVYFNEDGAVTTGDSSKGEKPAKTFGYSKEDYPQYSACIEQKHHRVEVRHSRSGAENTVSCPLCKIYWKYDSSD